MSPRRPAVLRDGGGDQTLREHLIATAARLVAERGGAGLTVRDIAREAKVADGVLYNHFSAKEELLAHGLRAHVHAVMADLGEPPQPGTGTLAENLHTYITRGLDVLTRIMPAFAGMISQPKVLVHFHTEGPPMHEHALPRALAHYLRAEQELGRVAPTAIPDAAAAMIIGACHELVLPRVFQGSPMTDFTVPSGFVDDLVATVMHGIAPTRSS
ncbi:TetR/AcrR family transcriptional regulator [Streptomyces sp. NPDC020681]|uniref:TetR/AcrR family transcriptional regulator n=1 Tax=Streptomyces sp. NPDC020681 TaxID=3365083 RepID=UPI0037BB5B76